MIMNFEMDKQYTIPVTEKQLIRIIELMKRGTMSRADNDLIQFLEWKLKYGGIELNKNLDEIPF